MPTPSPEPTRGPAARRVPAAASVPAAALRAALIVLTVLVLLAATGCSLLPGSGEEPAPAARTSTAAQLQELLDRQARAVRRGDRPAYAATLVPVGGDRGAGDGGGPAPGRRAALRAFDGLSALPLARYRLEVDPATVVLTARGGAVAEVTSEVQLAGFDAVPVRTPALVHFAPSGDGGGFRVARPRDASWARERGVAPQPWEVADLVVRRGQGVLVLADRGSADAVDALVAATEAAVGEVAARVPVAWDRTVVLHALSSTAALAGLPSVPGGDPEQLDGVTLPVRAEPGAGPLASTRVVLHPRMTAPGAVGLDRLLRHELVHVALAGRDDRLPTWLAEGVAEWVSVQPLAPADRTVARAALDAAREGVDALPRDEDFNGPESGANYGIAWHAVEHLAAAYGEDLVWQLVEDLRARGDDPAEVDRALAALTGLTTAELASAAGTRLVTTFG